MFAELLVQEAILQRADPTQRTDAGEVVESWTSVGTVPCLARLAKQPADVPIGVNSLVTHVVYVMPLETPMITRLIIEGSAYRVVSARDPGHRGHHLELLCRSEESPA